MNTTTTAAQLPADVETLMRALRLLHARAIAADVLATARAQRWDPTEVIKALLTEETAGRARSMLAARRKAAGFPTGKTFDAWDPGASSIPLPTQQALQTLEWVGRRENLVVCGPAGTGKTFFLEALGQKVIEAGMPVTWFTLEQIGVLVRAHRADDSLGKAVAKIVRAELVVIDLCRPRNYAEVVGRRSCCRRSAVGRFRGSVGIVSSSVRRCRCRSTALRNGGDGHVWNTEKGGTAHAICGGLPLQAVGDGLRTRDSQGSVEGARSTWPVDDRERCCCLTT